MNRFFPMLLFALLAQRPLLAQGTFYFSNLAESPASSVPVGADRWFATSFDTGIHPGGYILNSITVRMAAATGNPNGFSVLLFSHREGDSRFPGSTSSALEGPDPIEAGGFNYNGASLSLLPATSYFIVLTATTPIATGAYSWSYTTSRTFISSDGWGLPGFQFFSDDGQTWNRTGGAFLQFAVNATPVPEPSSLVLLGCGSLIFLARIIGSRQRSKG